MHERARVSFVVLTDSNNAGGIIAVSAARSGRYRVSFAVLPLLPATTETIVDPANGRTKTGRECIILRAA